MSLYNKISSATGISRTSIKIFLINFGTSNRRIAPRTGHGIMAEQVVWQNVDQTAEDHNIPTPNLKLYLYLSVSQKRANAEDKNTENFTKNLRVRITWLIHYIRNLNEVKRTYLGSNVGLG